MNYSRSKIEQRFVPFVLFTVHRNSAGWKTPITTHENFNRNNDKRERKKNGRIHRFSRNTADSWIPISFPPDINCEFFPPSTAYRSFISISTDNGKGILRRLWTGRIRGSYWNFQPLSCVSLLYFLPPSPLLFFISFFLISNAFPIVTAPTLS